MASIEKRISKDGKVSYRASVRKKGTPKQTATFSSLTKAKEWGHRTEIKISDGKYLSEIKSKKHVLSDIIKRYIDTVLIHKPKIQKDWIQQLNWWSKRLGMYTLHDITPALISKYKEELITQPSARGTPRSPSTVNRYLTTIQCVFSQCVKEWDLLDANPFAKVKKFFE